MNIVVVVLQAENSLYLGCTRGWAGAIERCDGPEEERRRRRKKKRGSAIVVYLAESALSSLSLSS